MKQTATILLILVALFSNAQLSVVNPRTDNRVNPLGVDSKQPVFSWQLSSHQKKALQTAYQILVADDSLLLKKNVANVWDSKQVVSSVSIQVAYKGKALQSAKQYYWKVIVKDNKGNTSASNIAYWQMGLLNEKDWQGAEWIAYENLPDSNRIVPFEHGNGKKEWGKRKNILPLFRKEFNINKKVKQATLFICGLGHFEAYINGKKVGNNFLDPGWTNYDKQALYVSFDVKDHLSTSGNAIGVMLGNGFYYIPSERYRKMTGAYGYPKMICRLLVQYEDSSIQNIVSDGSWRTAPSPITFSSIYGGEDYDATLEQDGWNKPIFDASSWKDAVTVSGHVLQSHSAPPLKVMDNLVPLTNKNVSEGVVVYDVGQNMSGIPHIIVQGKKGDTIRIITGELLNANGTVNQKATGSPHFYTYILKGKGVDTWQYLVKGNGAEIWQPRFSYYGFRYIQVERVAQVGDSNSKNLPVIISASALHTRNSAERVGLFKNSNNLFGQIDQLIDWSIKSNMASTLTDCPTREKIGWLEQDYLMGNSVRYNYDIQKLAEKILKDVAAAQEANGMIPEYAPKYVHMPFLDGIFTESPEWGSVAVILPWYLYQWYGNKQFLQEYYPVMKRYMQYLQGRTKNNILLFGLSDWYDLGPNKPGLCQLTPMGLTATATYYYNLHIMQQVANLLNKQQEANSFAIEAKQVKEAFNKKFFNKDSLYYGTNSQTANAMALYMNLVEPKYKQAVLNNLVNSIKANDYKITAGDIGFRYLLQVLHKEGYSNIIYTMNNRSDVPGYGYQIAKGATALTESWQALPSVSNNHLMLGHLMEWFYAGLAGIGQEAGSIAYKNISVKPEVVGDITHAAASYQSVHGTIASEWHKQENEFKLKVLIPANTHAIVYLPASKTATVLQDGKTIQPIFKDGRAIVKVGSGVYEFVVK